MIHYTSEDRIAQAISRFKAEQSGLWHRFEDGSERERLSTGHQLNYDTQAIKAIVDNVSDDEASWIDWMEQHSIHPLPLKYEYLAAKPQKALASILKELCVYASVATSIQPVSAKMADAESQAWAERFRLSQPIKSGC